MSSLVLIFNVESHGDTHFGSTCRRYAVMIANSSHAMSRPFMCVHIVVLEISLFRRLGDTAYMVTDAAGDALLQSSSLPPRSVRTVHVLPMPVLTPAICFLCYAQICASRQLPPLNEAEGHVMVGGRRPGLLLQLATPR